MQKLKLCVPIRDMRLLDPNLLTSETGKILVRDNVIVVSIEHVRLIITADCVIIPREGFDHNPLNISFNSLLEDVIAEFAEVGSFLAYCPLKHLKHTEYDRIATHLLLQAVLPVAKWTCLLHSPVCISQGEQSWCYFRGTRPAGS